MKAVLLRGGENGAKSPAIRVKFHEKVRDILQVHKV
jgi:hypothetical protein